MFFLPALAFTVGMTLKSFFDGFARGLSIMRRLKKIFSAAIFAYASWVFYFYKVKDVPSFPIEFLLGSLAILVLVVIPKPLFVKNSSIFGFFKALVCFLIIATAIFVFALSRYHKLILGSPFMVIRMTGEKEKKTVATLKAMGQAEEVVDCYRVLFEDLKGKK